MRVILADPLLRFLAGHCLGGIAAGALLVGGLLLFDVGGLAALVFGSSDPGLVIGLLFFGMAVTFGSVAMGVAIMQLREDDDGDR